VALSGLAHALSDAVQEQYIAGCWKSSLLESLDWRVVFPRSGPLSKARAPSWSWASIDENMTCLPLPKDSYLLMSLLEVHGTHSNNDPFGRMEETGFIALSGHLVTAHLHHIKDVHYQPMRLSITGCQYLVKAYGDRPDEFIEEGTQIFCLALKVYPTINGNHGTTHEVCLMGLLLRRIEARNECFQRVGHFTMNAEDGLQMFGIDMAHVSSCSILSDAESHTVIRIY
jgi:hypothetical protein